MHRIRARVTLPICPCRAQHPQWHHPQWAKAHLPRVHQQQSAQACFPTKPQRRQLHQVCHQNLAHHSGKLIWPIQTALPPPPSQIHAGSALRTRCKGRCTAQKQWSAIVLLSRCQQPHRAATLLAAEGKKPCRLQRWRRECSSPPRPSPQKMTCHPQQGMMHMGLSAWKCGASHAAVSGHRWVKSHDEMSAMTELDGAVGAAANTAV